MKRRYLVAVLLLAAITLIVSRDWPKAGDSVPQSAKAGEPGLQPAKAGMNVAEQAARREAANRLARMSPTLPHVQVGKYSAETIQSVERAFRGMIAVRGLVIQDKERRALAQQVLALPDGSALMREILLDPAFARSAFGDFQAEARFYAIPVLKEVARQGNTDFVSENRPLVAMLVAAANWPSDDRQAGSDQATAAAVARKLHDAVATCASTSSVAAAMKGASGS
jgi:hypothetical protein